MFHNFNPIAVPAEAPQWRAARPADEARELISRYPSLSETELARLINLYRQLSALDMALMLSDQHVAPNLDRFSADHRAKVRPPFRHYAALLIYGAVGLAVLAWAIARASGA